jgi:hypothetical protein
MKLTNQDKALIIMALTTVGLAIIGLVLLTSVLSVGVLRAWAVASIFIIPLTGLAGWRLGTRDARAHLSGLDKGIDSVMRAADRTANLRTMAATRARQVMAVTSTPQPLRLPDPEIVHVRPASDDEVIDL